jgi:hypothetical protein
MEHPPRGSCELEVGGSLSRARTLKSDVKEIKCGLDWPGLRRVGGRAQDGGEHLLVTGRCIAGSWSGFSACIRLSAVLLGCFQGGWEYAICVSVDTKVREGAPCISCCVVNFLKCLQAPSLCSLS